MTQALVEVSKQPIPTANSEAETVQQELNFLYYIRRLHGLVLGTSFMVFFPVGAMIIHMGKLNKSFLYHWTLQLFLTTTGFATVIIGLIFSESGGNVSVSNPNSVLSKLTNNQFRNFRGTHQIFGAVIFSCLILQIALGNLHHINFVRFKRRTLVSYAHICIGWLILTLGVINTKLYVA